MTTPAITGILLSELEERAKAATPGPWVAYGGKYTGSVYAGRVSGPLVASVEPRAVREGSDVSAYYAMDADTQYIAAVSPDVVLALVAEVRRLWRMCSSAPEYRCDGCAGFYRGTVLMMDGEEPTTVGRCPACTERKGPR